MKDTVVRLRAEYNANLFVSLPYEYPKSGKNEMGLNYLYQNYWVL